MKNKNVLIAVIGGIVACLVCAGIIFLYPKSENNLKGNQTQAGYEEEIILGDDCSSCMSQCQGTESYCAGICADDCSSPSTPTPTATATATATATTTPRPSITCTNPTYTGSSLTIATCTNGTISNATQTNVGSYTVTCTGTGGTDAKSCSILAKGAATPTPTATATATPAGPSSCRAGTYWNASSRICTACPSGQYQDKSGQTSCITCKAGEYQDTPGQTACKKCYGTVSYDHKTCTPTATTTPTPTSSGGNNDTAYWDCYGRCLESSYDIDGCKSKCESQYGAPSTQTPKATSSPTSTSVNCAAGQYYDGSACRSCSGNTNGYYPNSAAGSVGKTSCYAQLDGSHEVIVAYAQPSSCASGFVQTAYRVYYGSTVRCTSCTSQGKVPDAANHQCVAGKGATPTPTPTQSGKDISTIVSCAGRNNVVLKDGSTVLKVEDYCTITEYVGATIKYYTCTGKGKYTGTWRGTCM